jgi:hypothetical protein
MTTYPSLDRNAADLERHVVHLDGFVMVHTDATVLSTGRTNGFSVARTGTGTYRITLDRPYRGLLSMKLQLCWNGAGGTITQLMADGLPTANWEPSGGVTTIDFVTATGPNTPADTGVTLGIYISLVLKNGGQAGAGGPG